MCLPKGVFFEERKKVRWKNERRIEIKDIKVSRYFLYDPIKFYDIFMAFILNMICPWENVYFSVDFISSFSSFLYRIHFDTVQIFLQQIFRNFFSLKFSCLVLQCLHSNNFSFLRIQ